MSSERITELLPFSVLCPYVQGLNSRKFLICLVWKKNSVYAHKQNFLFSCRKDCCREILTDYTLQTLSDYKSQAIDNRSGMAIKGIPGSKGEKIRLEHFHFSVQFFLNLSFSRIFFYPPCTCLSTVISYFSSFLNFYQWISFMGVFCFIIFSTKDLHCGTCPTFTSLLELWHILRSYFLPSFYFFSVLHLWLDKYENKCYWVISSY